MKKIFNMIERTIEKGLHCRYIFKHKQNQYGIIIVILDLKRKNKYVDSIYIPTVIITKLKYIYINHGIRSFNNDFIYYIINNVKKSAFRTSLIKYSSVNWGELWKK